MAAAVTIASPPAHTNDTQGARRIQAAFSAARREQRAALIPYIVAGYPDADGSFAVQGPRPWRIARAEYLPVFGLGQASTDWIPAG